MNQNWMDDPILSGIAKEKLIFLQSVVFDSQKLKQNEMMPYVLAMSGKAKKSNISFSKEETEKIIQAMKKTSTKEDLNRMNQVLSLTNLL